MRRRPRPPAALALASLLALVGCHDQAQQDTADDPWLVPEQDLGAPRASGQGFVVQNGTDAWFAAEHISPMLEWDFPATEQPWFLWDLVQGENIADESTCPYIQADSSAGTRTWTSNCRSRDGYDWRGTVTQTVPGSDNDWTPSLGDRAGVGDDPDWERWDYDLEIIGDIEDPSFDRLTLKGAIFFVRGDQTHLVRAAQVNMRVGVDGYWERHHVGDEREQSWNDLLLSGHWEELPDGVHHFSGTADLGEFGGFAFESEALTEQLTCSGEPQGTLILTTDDAVVLSFQGADDCDRCATYAVNGEYAGRACDF